VAGELLLGVLHAVETAFLLFELAHDRLTGGRGDGDDAEE
jgi:hypothetical protein